VNFSKQGRFCFDAFASCGWWLLLLLLRQCCCQSAELFVATVLLQAGIGRLSGGMGGGRNEVSNITKILQLRVDHLSAVIHVSSLCCLREQLRTAASSGLECKGL
jgi:hypothetical protein